MISLFFRIGNTIIQREKICSAEYQEYQKEEAKAFTGGVTKRLHLHMEDGQEIKLSNDDAEQVWAMLTSAAVDITPIKSAVDDQ